MFRLAVLPLTGKIAFRSNPQSRLRRASPLYRGHEGCVLSLVPPLQGGAERSEAGGCFLLAVVSLIGRIAYRYTRVGTKPLPCTSFVQRQVPAQPLRSLHPPLAALPCGPPVTALPCQPPGKGARGPCSNNVIIPPFAAGNKLLISPGRNGTLTIK